MVYILYYTYTTMKAAIQGRAIKMRRAGKSIKEIAKALEVSVSTVSRWCKDIELTKSQREILDERRRSAGIEALLPWIEKNQQLKASDIRAQNILGAKDMGTLSKRDIFQLGIGLYWGEGYKRGSQEFGLTNSDPLIIRFILNWLQVCYGVEMDRIIARVTINRRYSDETKRITRAWSKQTGIPLTQFSSPTYIEGYGKPGRDGKTYLGTLRIKVRNSTSLRRRILASITAASA